MKKLKSLSILTLSAFLVLSGCTTATNAVSTDQLVKEKAAVDVTTTSTTNTKTTNTTTNTTSTTTTSTSQISALLAEKQEYNDKDEYTNWKNSTYTTVKFSGSTGTVSGKGATLSNGVLNITEAGTYVLSGKFTGSILVNASKEADVRLVLNGVEITSNTTAPIQVYKANKVVISLENKTTNTLTDKALTVLSKNKDGDEITATIYSKEDIIINGTGTLVINANTNDGITSKDDLIIMSGTIKIKAADDGIVGKDSVQIKNGTITVNSVGDGIKSSNDTDAGEGYILINGGTFTIASGDDAIKGEQQVIITGGTINITKSVEGIESIDLIFAGGKINLKSSDDGINAAGGTTNQITILGGDIIVDAQGDGIDANGSITMSGGTVTVNGPTNGGNGALDYDGSFNISGGTLNIAGSAGMAMATSNTSKQNTISYTFSSVQKANSKVELKDSTGKVVATITPTKNFQNVVFSNANIKTNATYSIYVNNTKVSDITVQSVVTYANANGVQQGQRGGMQPPQGGMQPGQRGPK